MVSVREGSGRVQVVAGHGVTWRGQFTMLFTFESVFCFNAGLYLAGLHVFELSK
jgi:hypothetical protein